MTVTPSLPVPPKSLKGALFRKPTIYGVQYLRGLAALGVVLCHFGSNLSAYPTLSKIFSFGQNGVHVFFLISGFIIVYSLTKADYKPAQFFRFLLKRSIRIDPSYYVTILLTLIFFRVLTLVPSFGGAAIPFIPQQFLAHLFYLVPFTKYEFYNHVFWTLCIEFQFYLLVGLLYFIIDAKVYRYCFLIALGFSSFIPFSNAYYLVFNYGAIFALGISLVPVFNNFTWSNWPLPTLFLIVIWLKFGFPIAALLAVSVVVLLFVKVHFGLLYHFGNISYSLYLIHSLVFIFTVGILKRLNFDLQKNQLMALTIEVLLAVVAAFMFYLLIELPSLRMSKKIFYKSSSSNRE